jgi:hypothetical protein
MELRRNIAGALIAAVAILAFVAGCGSSSDDSSSNAGSSTASGESSASGGEGSAEFLSKKGENKIVKFGEEASEEERDEASEVLVENLKARAAADFATQCDSLTKAAIEKVEESAINLGRANEKGCENALQVAAEPLFETEEIRAFNMEGPVGALRVKGKKAYALYHGTENKDYYIEMEKVGDEWKVARLKTEELPK